MGQLLGRAKTGELRKKKTKKKHLAHLQGDLGLSHIWPVLGSKPHQTQCHW